MGNLTDKPNPWFQMVVCKKLDGLVWGFPYTSETQREIEDGLTKLEDFKRYYKARISQALDKSMILWYTQRVESLDLDINYYNKIYGEKKEL